MNDSSDWHSCASASESETDAAGLGSLGNSDVSVVFQEAHSPDRVGDLISASAEVRMRLAELPDSPWINVTSPGRGYMQPRRSWPSLGQSPAKSLTPFNYSFHLPPSDTKISSVTSNHAVPILELPVGSMPDRTGKTTSAPESARESEIPTSCPTLPIQRKHCSPKAKPAGQCQSSSSLDDTTSPVALDTPKPHPKPCLPASPTTSPMPVPSSPSAPSSPSTSPLPSPREATERWKEGCSA